MALTNMDKRRPNLVSKRERTVERERREGEKKNMRKRKRRRREEEVKQSQKGMKLINLSMDLWFCMIIILPKPRVFSRVSS